MDDRLSFIAIVLVAIIAIVGIISIGYVQMPVTSFAATNTTSGTAQVSVSQIVSITLIQATTDFGSGYVDPAESYALINSEGTKTNWINTTAFSPSPMILENNGNVGANVTIKAAQDASSFIGGSTVTPEQK